MNKAPVLGGFDHHSAKAEEICGRLAVIRRNILYGELGDFDYSKSVTNMNYFDEDSNTIVFRAKAAPPKMEAVLKKKKGSSRAGQVLLRQVKGASSRNSRKNTPTPNVVFKHELGFPYDIDQLEEMQLGELDVLLLRLKCPGFTLNREQKVEKILELQQDFVLTTIGDFDDDKKESSDS